MTLNSARIRWLQGIYADGWVSTRAFLKLSHVQSLSFRIYLRPGEDLYAKKVIFRAGQELVAEAALQRGVLNEIEFSIPAEPQPAIITIESEYPEVQMAGQDARQRGFLLRALRVNNENWQQPGPAGGKDQDPDGDDRFTVSDYMAIETQFDRDFYLSGFGGDEPAPANLLLHYLTRGWKEGRDPANWFSSAYYLEQNGDVAAAGVNPFVHFVNRGRDEGRQAKPPAQPAPQYFEAATAAARDLYAEQQFFAEPGPAFDPHRNLQS